MFFSLDQITQLLLQYKYWILFPIMVIEGPIITVVAGLIIALGYMNFFITYAVVLAGDVTGDVIYYAMGRWGREKFLQRWGKYIGLRPERVVHIEKHFERHGNKTLFIGKMAHGIGSIFLVAAGLVRMPFSKFMWANTTATLIKSLALLLIGFYFGQAIEKIGSVFEFVSAISVSIGIIVALFFFAYSRKKDKEYE